MSLAVANELKEVTDLAGLQNIKARITRISRETQSVNYRIGIVDSNISQQIQKLNSQKTVYNLRNNIPSAVEKLVQSIANGTMNIEEANEIIAQEAERRVSLTEKSRFSLSKEQQERQVTIQVRTLLSERGDTYSIKDPNKALEQLNQLSKKDVGKSQLFKIVAQNLLEIYPSMKKGQAEFYSKHCTIGKYYTISQYKKLLDVAYETARTSMDNLADLGFYRKEKLNNKFIYTPLPRR